MESQKKILSRNTEPKTVTSKACPDKYIPGLEPAFNAIEDWVCIIDTQFTILRSNQAVEKHFNIPVNQVLGTYCHTLVHKSKVPVPDCPLPRMLASGKRESAKIELPDGRWLMVTLDPIRDKRGRILSAVHITRDITHEMLLRNERKALVKELKKALGRIKTLSGLIPICSSCKKIRDDQGYWNLIETYIENHSHASFSHGICPDCIEKMYGQEPWYTGNHKKQDE